MENMKMPGTHDTVNMAALLGLFTVAKTTAQHYVPWAFGGGAVGEDLPPVDHTVNQKAQETLNTDNNPGDPGDSWGTTILDQIPILGKVNRGAQTVSYYYGNTIGLAPWWGQIFLLSVGMYAAKQGYNKLFGPAASNITTHVNVQPPHVTVNIDGKALRQQVDPEIQKAVEVALEAQEKKKQEETKALIAEQEKQAASAA